MTPIEILASIRPVMLPPVSSFVTSLPLFCEHAAHRGGVQASSRRGRAGSFRARAGPWLGAGRFMRILSARKLTLARRQKRRRREGDAYARAAGPLWLCNDGRV